MGYTRFPAHDLAWGLKRDRAFALLELQPGDRVLEIGCGTGSDLQRVADQAHLGVGMDLAWVRFPPVEAWGQRRFVAGNGVSLPFADGAFDKVLMLEVIEHFPGEGVGCLLHEIRRVLLPGGRLVLSTPRRRALANPLRYPFQWLTRLPGVVRQEWKELCEAHRARMAQLEKESGIEEHERLYTARELRTLLESHGFVVQALQGGTISPYMTGTLHAESVSRPLYLLWRLLNLTSIWPACAWDMIVRAVRPVWRC